MGAIKLFSKQLISEETNVFLARIKIANVCIVTFSSYSFYY
jgi:hypothetical protein